MLLLTALPSTICWSASATGCATVCQALPRLLHPRGPAHASNAATTCHFTWQTPPPQTGTLTAAHGSPSAQAPGTGLPRRQSFWPAKYVLLPLGSGLIVAPPGRQLAGHTSPCSSVNCAPQKNNQTSCPMGLREDRGCSDCCRVLMTQLCQGCVQ